MQSLAFQRQFMIQESVYKVKEMMLLDIDLKRSKGRITVRLLIQSRSSKENKIGKHLGKEERTKMVQLKNQMALVAPTVT